MRPRKRTCSGPAWGPALNRQDQETLRPQWLAHRFEEGSNQIRFVEHDRATRASVPFLTDQYLPESPIRAEPRDRARALAPAAAPVRFIFHSGFCCSTLFASCFDQPGLASTFSEPMILNDAVGWRKRGAPPAEVGRLLDDALTLLARPFEGDQAAVLKPSTVVNGLAAAMMRLRPDAKAIVMHAPVEDFVTSIAKKGIDGRAWARELFLNMRREGLVEGMGFTDEQFFGQTDLQIAAIAWLGQQRLFGELVRAFPGRVKALDSDSFLERPDRAIEAGAALFRLEISEEQLKAAKAGVLTRNSKDRKPFSRGARKAEYRAARKVHDDEIGKVAVWAAAVAEAASIATDLHDRLL